MHKYKGHNNTICMIKWIAWLLTIYKATQNKFCFLSTARIWLLSACSKYSITQYFFIIFFVFCARSACNNVSLCVTKLAPLCNFVTKKEDTGVCKRLSMLEKLPMTTCTHNMPESRMENRLFGVT